MGSQHKLKAALVCLLMTMALSGCGGGGGGGSVSTPVYPPPATIFSDSFADGTNWSSRWTPENDTGGVESWNVVAGVLLQSTTLEVGAFEATFLGTTSYHLGTYARLVDPALNGISNYRFSVGITPLTNVPPDREGNDVGIMFRYQNPFSYYRVSMNARYGFTRFEKRVGNTFETLAVNAIGYDDGLPITMTAEVNGNTIIVWIDGEPVFAVVDSSIPSGTVALYCQDRAQFDNVLITENPTAPVVAISSPLAYSIDTDNSFTAQAVVLNMPAGGRVAFSLDGGSEITGAGVGQRLFPSCLPACQMGIIIFRLS